MKSILIATWFSLVLGSASVCAAELTNSGNLAPVHDHEPSAHATAPRPGGYLPDESGHEDHGHGQDEAHGDQHAGENEHGSEGGDHGHAEAHGRSGEEPLEVHLSPDQIKTLGIRTERLTPRALGAILIAPGEVRLNTYASAQVAPRVMAQITERHARLGDRVAAGQALVTLSSVEMAEAQGNLVVAEREWQRVRKLGRKVVSESRYLEAQIGRQQARARAIAFGMTSDQVDALLRSGAGKADGSFALLAPQSGTVIADDFVLGEVIEAGRTLFGITDESVRWIEARMSPEDAARVTVGDPVRVGDSGVSLEGKVSQIHHQLDESTRTQAIRVEVPDPDHLLHPGVFVDVNVYAGKGKPVLALPEAAVLRGSDGDWQVFVSGDETGSYKPVEVTLMGTTGGLAVIKGLAPGTQVVVSGAFFLQSEIAKGGFDIHQH